jgi:hypothetical protein
MTRGILYFNYVYVLYIYIYMPRGRTKKTVNEPNINWTKHSKNTRHRKEKMENLEKDIKNLMGEFNIIKPKRPRSSGKRPSGKNTKRVDPRHKRFKPRVAGKTRGRKRKKRVSV